MVCAIIHIIMSKRKALYSILVILFLISLILGGIFHVSQKKSLQVNFLDIGQGDSILISRGSKQILIDGGPDGQKVLEKLGRYIPFWDRNIEVIIATHPDQDHIDGLIDVMKAYSVGEIIDNSFQSDAAVYKKYLETAEEEKIPRLRGENGINIKIDEDAQIKILHPGKNDDNNSEDSNSGSIVSKLTFGENSFLFTGDLPDKKERELVANNADLSSRVLKVSHHGSKYASTEEFLGKVHPVEAVISVGKNNRYGHPSLEALERLRSRGIRILRTDESGDIIYECEKKEDFCSLNLPK